MHIVFAKGGVENIIALLYTFSRACFSTSHFFSNLVSWKKHSLRLVEIELFGQFSPPFANTFSDVAKSAPLLLPHRFGGLHPQMLLVSTRTSHICEFAKSQERKKTSFSGLRKSAEPLTAIL